MTAIEAAIAPILRAHGVEPVEVALKTEQGGWVLRVKVERPGTTDPAGGLTVDVLGDISRDLSTALDVTDPIPQRYSLEVSSPGLDRPLNGASDYQRFSGKLAKVHLARPAPDGQSVLRGLISSADGDRLTIDVSGKPVTVPFADVTRGHLVFEMGAQPKRSITSGQPKHPRPSKTSKHKGKR